MGDKNLIIGTAGHIDHGKTSLIKALTGDDTDRLKEEKDRGISIELGFTKLDLADNLQVGIIDVPGHEKFIKNMLAGAGGVDLALLIIAADEGIMPQTEEHLEILSLLNVKYGVIVITKIDLVDEDWLELVREDIRERLSSTFLKDAPLISVSAVTKEGIEQLKSELLDVINKIPVKKNEGNSYFPIDRVFTLSGFGTIVTGTLVSGTINTKEKLTIYPQGKEVRIRSLQVHNQKVKRAVPGQRVGINLAGIDTEEVERGDVLATTDSLSSTEYIDGRLKLLKDLPMVLRNGDKIRFHIGARESLGRVYLLDKKELYPGEEALVQFKLEEKIVARYNENYVIRRCSPLQTIGGGNVIENNSGWKKRFNDQVIKELKLKEEGDIKTRVELALQFNIERPLTLKNIVKKTNLSKAEIKDILDELISSSRVVSFSDQQVTSWLHQKVYYNIREKIIEILNVFHSDYPLRQGLSQEELRNRIELKFNKKEFNTLLSGLEEEKVISLCGSYVELKSFNVKFSPEEEEIKEQILSRLFADKFTPPSPENIFLEIGVNNELAKEVFNALYQKGTLVKIKEGFFLHHKLLEEGKRKLLTYLQQHYTIELGEYRDLLESSRKYVLPLLEYFDNIGLTRKKGDKRVLAEK